MNMHWDAEDCALIMDCKECLRYWSCDIPSHDDEESEEDDNAT